MNNIEIKWYDIDCISPEALNDMMNIGYCLLENDRGIVTLVGIMSSNAFLKNIGYAGLMYFSSDEYLEYDLDTDDVEKYVKQFEFICYKRLDHIESDGECYGCETIIYDDAVKIGLLPKSPIISALMDGPGYKF